VKHGLLVPVLVVLALLCFSRRAVSGTPAQSAAIPPTQEGDYIEHDFHFKSGESMAELRMHYTTLGEPVRDANGHTTNAVLIMHGTGGSGRTFLLPIFAGVLFGPGQLLDANRYFIILPDDIGMTRQPTALLNSQLV
jgi:homoserine O-acetyltransferase/O-succinyltransferase